MERGRLRTRSEDEFDCYPGNPPKPESPPSEPRRAKRSSPTGTAQTPAIPLDVVVQLLLAAVSGRTTAPREELLSYANTSAEPPQIAGGSAVGASPLPPAGPPPGTGQQTCPAALTALGAGGLERPPVGSSPPCCPHCLGGTGPRPGGAARSREGGATSLPLHRAGAVT
ncbi:PREDICTED: uncharacterized protein Rv2082-like [Ficedula albicollis]|uniref:uncharacterized protein Rv2082-like n=1 Tax=Ficedula albicollis TaxID=59894 RepID=UPI0003595A7F|nr:PREDICTED: uncharacterized protein Rv2082-like [Ficedula albicollis]